MKDTYTYTFKVEPRMFRRALYFNTFKKSRFQELIFIVVWALGVGMLVANLGFRVEMSSTMQLCYAVFLVTLPLMVFSCEQGWRRYRSSGMSEKPRTVSLSDEWLKFRVGGSPESEKLEWRMLAGVYELDWAFIIYRDSNLMIVLPKAVIPAEDIAGLRALFQVSLGRGFRARGSAAPARDAVRAVAP